MNEYTNMIPLTDYMVLKSQPQEVLDALGIDLDEMAKSLEMDLAKACKSCGKKVDKGFGCSGEHEGDEVEKKEEKVLKKADDEEEDEEEVEKSEDVDEDEEEVEKSEDMDEEEEEEEDEVEKSLDMDIEYYDEGD